ncbi:MAG TPA: hypothetical protein VF780_07930, partial [Nitrosospira sp.]
AILFFMIETFDKNTPSFLTRRERSTICGHKIVIIIVLIMVQDCRLFCALANSSAWPYSL